MKVFGYIEGNHDQLFRLSEVTFQAKPQTLKAVANFLLKCAKEMEDDDSWEHEHFADSTFTDVVLTDIIVFRDN